MLKQNEMWMWTMLFVPLSLCMILAGTYLAIEIYSYTLHLEFDTEFGRIRAWFDRKTCWFHKKSKVNTVYIRTSIQVGGILWRFKFIYSGFGSKFERVHRPTEFLKPSKCQQKLKIKQN